MGPKFFETRMGQQFYDGTMTRLVRALESLATSAERLVEAAEKLAVAEQTRTSTGSRGRSVRCRVGGGSPVTRTTARKSWTCTNSPNGVCDATRPHSASVL
jgi:hypothetical protein